MSESTNTTSILTSTTSDTTSVLTDTTTTTGPTGPTTITTISSTTLTPSDTSSSSTSSSSSSSSSSSLSLPSSSTPSSSSTPIFSSSTPPSSIPSPSLRTSVTVVTPSEGPPTTVIQTITTTNTQASIPNTSASAASSSTPSASAVGSAGTSSGGTSNGPSAGVVAPAVIVPVIVIALAIILGIFLWRRKQRQEAAEMRQKEMEEYSYNPNSDPTIPVAGAVSSNGDDQNGEGGGYRGWGTTSSAGPRKPSTTLGGSSNPGAIGIARSDSGGRGYDDHSPHAITPEKNGSATGSPDGIGLLGTGPLASNNKNQGVNRGISNASSAYSGGQKSNGSDNAPGGFAGSPQQYYDELMQPDEGGHEGYGQPVIRDVSARRNTRIENPAIYPQHGNAGIAQNF